MRYSSRRLCWASSSRCCSRTRAASRRTLPVWGHEKESGSKKMLSSMACFRGQVSALRQSVQAAAFSRSTRSGMETEDPGISNRSRCIFASTRASCSSFT